MIEIPICLNSDNSKFVFEAKSFIDTDKAKNTHKRVKL